MKEFSYEIKDPMGLHARPAGLLVKEAAAFKSAITITAPGGKADAKRIMAVMRLAAKQGNTLTFTCEGEDEAAAATKLQSFLAANL